MEDDGRHCLGLWLESVLVVTLSGVARLNTLSSLYSNGRWVGFIIEFCLLLDLQQFEMGKMFQGECINFLL